MTKFCRFTDLHETTVYVNPSAVRFLCPNAHSGGGTSVYFDKEHWITVKDSLEDVAAVLEAADGES
jgi:hypothetical protein